MAAYQSMQGLFRTMTTKYKAVSGAFCAHVGILCHNTEKRPLCVPGRAVACVPVFLCSGVILFRLYALFH